MKNKQKNLICSSFLLSWVFFHQELKCGSWLFAHLIASITVNWRHISKYRPIHIWLIGLVFLAPALHDEQNVCSRENSRENMQQNQTDYHITKWWGILIAQYSCSNYAIGIHAIHSKYVNWIDASQYLHKTNHYYSLDLIDTCVTVDAVIAYFNWNWNKCDIFYCEHFYCRHSRELFSDAYFSAQYGLLCHWIWLGFAIFCYMVVCYGFIFRVCVSLYSHQQLNYVI